jgi:tripartite-type tricarboxylate transporter receptor subunit TctC
LLGLFLLGMGSSAAEDLPKQYPERSIKILVGFAAGGGTDVAARIVAQKLTETIGQSVVVENRPGASGMIAAETVRNRVRTDTR